MASPHASSFICLPFTDKNDTERAYKIHYYVCIGSATVGAIGALLFLCQLLCGNVKNMITKSQKNILVSLAVCDFLADLGVIARSILYIVFWKGKRLDEIDFDDNHQDGDDQFKQAVGSFAVEFWIAFWYIASYFWTFFFAVDIYSSKHNGLWRLWCSHSVTWAYSFVLGGLSIAALWVCQPYFKCTAELSCILSHFSCTFGPIVMFLIALPLFYVSILRKMEKTFNEGLMIEARRREKEQAKKKVFIFIFVFYICWIINALDGVLLIVGHVLNLYVSSNLYEVLYSPYYIYSVWMLEAILNPLQGLLNAVAYGNMFESIWNSFKSFKTKIENSAKFSSWSGEFIDVDFREGTRGRIGTAKRTFNRSQ